MFRSFLPIIHYDAKTSSTFKLSRWLHHLLCSRCRSCIHVVFFIYCSRTWHAECFSFAIWSPGRWSRLVLFWDGGWPLFFWMPESARGYQKWSQVLWLCVSTVRSSGLGMQQQDAEDFCETSWDKLDDRCWRFWTTLPSNALETDFHVHWACRVFSSLSPFCLCISFHSVLLHTCRRMIHYNTLHTCCIEDVLSWPMHADIGYVTHVGPWPRAFGRLVSQYWTLLDSQARQSTNPHVSPEL